MPALILVYGFGSINPLDAAIGAGYLASMLTPPLTLGVDFSGEVVEVGKDVTHVKLGDEVFGVMPFSSGTFQNMHYPKLAKWYASPNRSITFMHPPLDCQLWPLGNRFLSMVNSKVVTGY